MRDNQLIPVSDLLLEIQCLNVTEVARNEFLRLLRSMAGRRVQLTRGALVKPHRVAMAQKMLSDGFTVAQTREALIERAKISRATTYRVITLALNARMPKVDHG
jgi:hypothetical protein